MICPSCGYDSVQELDEVRALLHKVAEEHGITVRALLSKSRTADLVAARKCAAVQMREWGLAFKTIGHYLGGRDHSTIHYAVTKGKP